MIREVWLRLRFWWFTCRHRCLECRSLLLDGGDFCSDVCEEKFTVESAW